MKFVDFTYAVIPAEEAFLSGELWAASKIIGRECSEMNEAYLKCKATKGEDAKACKREASSVRSCTVDVVGIIKSKFADEYTAFQKCLDYNDYRFSDCRGTEKALHDCWNTHMGYGVKEREG